MNTTNITRRVLYDVKELTKTFRRGDSLNTAVDHVSFQVCDQQRLGIVGESGSGKSTLVRMLAGLLKPSSGSIDFDGISITESTDKQLRSLRRDVQMVFQDPRSSLDPRMKVGTTILEPLTSPIWKPHERIDAHQRLDEVLSMVGLDPQDARRYPHQFSGGQRQRIAIARAVVTRPRVLIADEPVSALDVSVRAQVINLIQDLARDHGLTVIFVSHDLSVVRHLCDTVLVLESGTIVEMGSTQQIYEDPHHPYTQQLVRSIPRLEKR